MNRLILTPFLLLLFVSRIAGQNVGVGTTSPQAKLHVNGTFKLQHGVIVNGISNDTTFNPGSDSLLTTQLAVKKYAERGGHLTPFQEMDSTFEGHQTVSMYPDSMLYTSPDGWQSDSALNVFTTQGNVGMGVINPTTKLAIHGNQKIEGNHVMIFGSGVPGWEQSAAKIGYGMLTPNTLDILGAGPAGNKKIRLWTDTWVRILGKSTVADTATFNEGQFENHVWSNGNIGVGVLPGADALSVKGKVRVAGGVFGGRSPIYGSMGYFELRLLREGECWDNYFGKPITALGEFHFSQTTQEIELGYYLPNSVRHPGLNVRGSLLVTDSLVVNNISQIKLIAKVANTKTLEMGAFIPGKEVNAGKIGYQTFTPNALDIVGAGTTHTNRKINLLAAEHVVATGNVTINGPLQATTIYSEPWTELGSALQNNWINYGDGFSTIAMYKDKEGVVHMRGLIKNGLNQQNTVIVNLPVGYRPVGGHQLFEVINGVDTFGRIDVETDGDVVFRGITNTFISLDQIVFKTN